MVVSKAIRATGCASCRLSLLRSVTPLPIRIIPAAGRFHATKIERQQIPFSSHSRLSEQHEVSHHQDALDGREVSVENKTDEEEVENENVKYEDILEDQELLDENKADGGEIGTSVSAVPWYLQVETPQTTPTTLSERQRIPDLPDLPPPILQPMLQHISVDLGLDDLTLLDLRKLDPPPALGANLIMLIGTARSEKHLHVSADRLCRWLRSTYKLRPSADGLLGRNELKLKIRRKSRRAKLLGSAADDNGDDGIRTGWVCVDIGVVESPDMHANAVPEGDGFVGFGRRTDGVRIVVQMLTEEKREEIDLEKLWGGILRRSGQSEVEDVEVTEDAEVEEPLSTSISQPSQHTPGSTIKSRGFQIPQTRQFHTSAQRKSDTPMNQQPNGILSSSQQDGKLENSRLTELQQSVLSDFSLGEFEKAKNNVLEYSANNVELDWQQFLLYQLRLYLENVPVEQAMSDLGKGYVSGDTSFLKCFKETVAGVRHPDHPASFKWDYVFWLFHYAQHIGHPWFKAIKIQNLFRKFEKEHFDDSDISDEYYHKIIRTILEPDRRVPDKSHAPTRLRILFALKVIQTMHRRGHKILTEKMFVTLQEATERILELDIPTVQPKATINDSFKIPTRAMTPIQRRIHTLMINLELPTFSDESRMRLMQLYAGNGHWIAFWDIWRLPLRQFKPQSADMYAYMFQRVAETGHQKGCIKTLRTWIEDLDREDPAVKLEGDIAEAVKACLLVAYPGVEQEAIANPEKPGEWVSLWRRCHGGDEEWKMMVETMVAEHEQRFGTVDSVEVDEENAAMINGQEPNQIYGDEFHGDLATASES
ncbi:ATPase synthesis protein 25 mitochondrial [Ciborinia camelliae]|nr:ATPase synthesis protein 25 mitochondrial [Ciborinia camelliae]